MKESARYVKIVEWCEEDQCFVGSCPGLFFGVSPRVVQDALRMYPSETLQLLEGNLTSKFFPDIVRLAKRAGYRIGFTIKKSPAA